MGALTPNTETEMADIIRSATNPLSIVGGGTRGVQTEGEVLSTTGLSGIALYEPGALTMVARSGTTMREIESTLAEHDQILPFEPFDLAPMLDAQGETTIGGVFATNASGARRLQVGAARDFLLGVRFVDGNGITIKNGGRVMKNVTGYDLVKLLAGSYGTLGVMTEVSFKVLPRPRSVAHLVADGVSVEDAVRAMTAASRTPYDISGAWYDLSNKQVCIRVEGFDDSVDYRATQLINHLGGHVALTETTKINPNRFMEENAQGDVWRIACRPTDAPFLSHKLDTDDQLLDWAGGRIWARVPEGTDVRAALGQFEGGATIVHAAAETVMRLSRFQPEPIGVARLSAGLRAKFDPRGILNKGLMG